MLAKILNLFKGTVAQPGATPSDPSAPTYVPTPKAKDPTAVHPLVKAKQLAPKGRATGVGIVYDREGRPKITRDWLDNLPAHERGAVDANLLAHGWRINKDSVIEKVA
jgi:hypothetical protein